MALDKFTQITKSGIVTTINFECHHLHSTGIATFSSGSISAVDGTFTGDVSIGGTLTYQDVTNIDSVGLVTARLGINVTAGVSTFAAAIDANGGVDISGGSGLVASTAKISDLTDNRVVIAGSSGELEDSANLTFDGSNLGVGSKITVTNANADADNTNSLGAEINAAWIRLGDKASAKTFSNGLGIKFHDGGTAHWSTGTIGDKFYISQTSNDSNKLFPSGRTDAVTVDSTGKVGINETTPEEILDLGESNKQNLKFGQRGYLGQTHSTAATILGHCVKADTTNSVASQMMVTETNSGGGAPAAIRMVSGTIQFHTASSGTADAVFDSERLHIKSDGKVGIATGDPWSILTAYGENRTDTGSATGQITAKDNAAYNANPTGGLIFQGHFASNNANAVFGGITGFKENATDGNYAGALAFHVRNNGAVAYEALRIASNGRVGIGSEIPAATIDVAGGGQFKTNGASVKIESSPGTNFTQLQLVNTGGNFYIGRENSAGNWFSSGTGYASVLRSDGAYPLIFRVNSSNRLTIKSDGHVGINVSPSMFLQVNNSSTGTSETDKRIAGFYKTQASSSSDREGYIHLSSYVGHYGVKLGYYNEGVTPGTLNSGFFVSTSGTSEQLTNHIKRLVIKSDGKVAIGNESPQQLLHVWPDTANTTSAYVRVTAGDRNSNTGIDIGHDASGNGHVNMVSNGTLAFSTNNAPRIKISSSSAATSIGGALTFNAFLTTQGDVSGGLLLLKAAENTNRFFVSGNDSNGVELNLYDEAGGQKGILGVSGSEFFIKAPSSSAPLRFYSHNGSAITEKLSIGLDTKDLVRTHRGFLIGKNRSKYSTSYGENKPSTPYYAGEGEKVFGIDPSWSNEELQKYFRSDNVQWYSDETAPGGYCIQIDGGVNVGGDYRSGFPYIPIDDDDQFFQEMWIRTHDGSQNHYAGSIQYDKDFAYGTGWPGSYGYELMSNTTINSTSWTRKTATLGPNHSSSYSMGSFRSNSSGYGGKRKYWTPQALFNYINNSGTRRCYISGWSVYRRRSRGNTYFASISKGSGSFQIKHPLEAKKDTHYLRHSFIEGSKCDNIYRGKATLSSGTATVNLDTEGTMTEGTFVALNDNVQCYTTNETGWSAVKGSVSGNILTITAQDNTSTDTISWMVVGERKDDEIKASDLTDGSGKLLVEPQVDQEYVGISSATLTAPSYEP